MPVLSNERPPFDAILMQIADYVLTPNVYTPLAYETARLCLMDSLGCGIFALSFPACRRVLGPVVPGAILPQGARVPGQKDPLDPVQATFNLSTMIRWLDFNDTWLAAEWGHPSDNIGAILAVSDYLNRAEGASILMQNVLEAIIQAYEIQGCLALENSFNRVGLDHVILVKLASAAVVSKLLGANRAQLLAALSHVFVDGQSLRTYRHSPNVGSRKSWAAGDAAARAVRLALLVRAGEEGYPSALTAKTWGFYDVSFNHQAFKLNQPFGSYIIENILFKLAYPAEFHAQTAVECAVQLHPLLKGRLDAVQSIHLKTHEAAMRIINKTGPLHNPADRDHCLQYMTAIGLIFGTLTAEHYEDQTAADPRVDFLRDKMQVVEAPDFSKDYLDPSKRAIANEMTVFLTDGTQLGPVRVDYPIGHRVRRAEGVPLLQAKYRRHLESYYQAPQVEKLIAMFGEPLGQMPVDQFMQGWG